MHTPSQPHSPILRTHLREHNFLQIRKDAGGTFSHLHALLNTLPADKVYRWNADDITSFLLFRECKIDSVAVLLLCPHNNTTTMSSLQSAIPILHYFPSLHLLFQPPITFLPFSHLLQPSHPPLSFLPLLLTKNYSSPALRKSYNHPYFPYSSSTLKLTHAMCEGENEFETITARFPKNPGTSEQ